MARKQRPSQMQVEIVDPSEVSQIIQLEPSVKALPRSGPTSGEPGQQPPGPRRQVNVRHNDPRQEQRSQAPQRVEQRSQAPQRVEQRSQAPQRVEQRSQAPQRAASGSQRRPQISQSPAAMGQPTMPSGSSQVVGGTATSPVMAVEKGAPVINEKLVARKLAVSVHAAIRDSECRRILITSPTSRSGTSHFARLVATEFAVIAPGYYRFLRHEDLEHISPPAFDDPQITVVDGPAMFDGDGLLVVPQLWMQAFDGCLLVVMGRHTESDFLEEAVKWMKDSRTHLIGLIWNDYLNPPPEMRFKLWRRYFKERKGEMFGDLLKVITSGGRSLRNRL